MFRDAETLREELGYCPQHDIMFPELTVAEHLRIWAGIKGVPSSGVEAEVQRMVKQVGLTEKSNAQVCTLSGGQKRKLSVSMALVGGSRIVFLDEPTSGKWNEC